MSEREHRILRSSFSSAAATLLSRLLGLGRVMLEARVLGGGAAAAAWQFAFMIPNLFRRLFGEGALAGALVPLIMKIEAEHGTEKARHDLGIVFLAMSGVLSAIIVISGGAIMLLNHFFSFQEYITGALTLVPMLLPYALFMCLVGVGGALLNTRGVFFLVSAGALIINVLMVALLSICYFGLHRPSINSLFLEMVGVVLGSGLLQLAMIAFLLFRRGLFPVLSLDSWRGNPILSNLWRLVLPGFIGYSALQLSVLVDSTLALGLGPQAVPALNYSNRIIDLPIGIYALSIGAVLLAQMSRSAAHERFHEIASDLAFSLRNVFFVCIPIAVFIMCCGETIVRVLYFGGRFGDENVRATCEALFFYGMGVPLFCSIKVITPAFYSRWDMKTPMYASLAAIACNIILSVILMFPFRQGGIALATVISSLINNSILLISLNRNTFKLPRLELTISFVRCAAASGIAAAAVLYAVRLMPPGLGGIRLLILQSLIFGAVYLACSAIYPRELRECLKIVGRRKLR